MNMPRNGSALLFSIEQWELIRRLRNSGLSKDQIGQAFDDLAKIELDLGTMYNIPNNSPGSNDSSSKFNNSQLLSNMQIFQMAKNLSSITRNNGNTNSQSPNSNYNLTNGNSFNKQSDQTSPKLEFNENSQTNGTHGSSQNGQASQAASIVNNHFASIMDPEQEAKIIEDFKLKGEVVIHGEISFFVYKHDLKQSQIARMAGVNQAYVSKFLRGEFFDLSENGKSLIYKWYLRFLKNPTIYQQAHNIAISPSLTANTNGVNGIADKTNYKLDSSLPINNVTNTYDAPKRSRFSFKQEHLVILEKAFIENQYPDQKRREDLSKQCNDAKPCSERVTEQIVTHWFQNKRKMNRKANTDDQSSPRNNGNSNNVFNQDEYQDDLSLAETYRNNDSNVDYQSESLIDYQDFIEDDNDFRNILDHPNNRKRSAESVDY